jgi:endonuclease YncB( thermonuclease family)
LALLACVFVLGIAFGSLLPLKPVHWPEAAAARGAGASAPDVASNAGQKGLIWERSGNRDVRHPIEVVRVIDGDTLEARVHLWPGLEMMTRVRLRGIDAPELKAHCPEERELAEIARDALQQMLAAGDVAIFNIGPDKYNGRVVADAATRGTPNVSSALLSAGHVRRYSGGHRSGWCAQTSRARGIASK